MARGGFSSWIRGCAWLGLSPGGCERDLGQGGGPSLWIPPFAYFLSFFFSPNKFSCPCHSLGRAGWGVPKGTERRGAVVQGCGCPRTVGVLGELAMRGPLPRPGGAAGKRWRRNGVKIGETKPRAGKSGSGDRVHAEDTFSRRLAVYYSRGVTSKPLDLSEAGHGAGQQRNRAGSRRPSPRPRAVRAENRLREEKVGGTRGAEGIYNWVYFYFITV